MTSPVSIGLPPCGYCFPVYVVVVFISLLNINISFSKKILVFFFLNAKVLQIFYQVKFFLLIFKIYFCLQLMIRLLASNFSRLLLLTLLSYLVLTKLLVFVNNIRSYTSFSIPRKFKSFLLRICATLGITTLTINKPSAFNCNLAYSIHLLSIFSMLPFTKNTLLQLLILGKWVMMHWKIQRESAP